MNSLPTSLEAQQGPVFMTSCGRGDGDSERLMDLSLRKKSLNCHRSPGLTHYTPPPGPGMLCESHEFAISSLGPFCFLLILANLWGSLGTAMPVCGTQGPAPPGSPPPRGSTVALCSTSPGAQPEQTLLNNEPGESGSPIPLAGRCPSKPKTKDPLALVALCLLTRWRSF